MKLSGPGLFLCLFLLFVYAKAQIEFGPDPKRTRPRGETVEVETRLNANKKQGGLLADILGVDPLGRPQNGNNGNFANNPSQNKPNFNGGQNNQNGRNSNCCCTRNNFCPSANGNLNNQGGDEDGFSGLKPRGDLEDLKSSIGVRIVNDAPSEAISKGGCPSGSRQCCYDSNINTNSFGNQCFQSNQQSQQFVPWDQGCLQEVPRNGGKQCGQRFFQPAQNLERGQASPEEFPWICMMLTDKDRFLGSCAIVPEDSDNDISSGTYRVITAAHKLGSLKQNEWNS